MHDELDSYLGALAGEFRVIRELGRGGMGAVYLAEEIRLQRLVALKVLLATNTDDVEANQRFLSEARTAAQLSHPNVVSVLRVEEAGDRFVIVMPYVEGDTLASKIQARGRLPAPEVAQILREIAWALGYAHGRGIIHRDVKPENVIIERGTSRSLVADFGIARNMSVASLTMPGVIVGTVHYMSPEQAAGDDLTGASDLYSLGVTGYLALTGQFPIDGPSLPAILVRHATFVPKPIREIRPDIPQDLAAAIDRCLSKSPQQRFPTAEAFANALGSTAAQRFEIPPLIRGWIARGHLLWPILTLWLLPNMLYPKDELMRMFGGTEDPTQPSILVMRTLVVAAGLLPALFVSLLVRLHDARRVLLAGFGLEDLRYGLRTELRQHGEERASSRARRTRTGRFARAGLAIAAAALSAAAMWFFITATQSALTGVSGVITALLGLAYVSNVVGVGTQLRVLRHAFWMRDSGRIFLRVAGAGVRSAAPGPHTDLIAAPRRVIPHPR